MAQSKTIEMIIPSKISQIQVVEERAEEIARTLGFNNDERDSLAIALTEVVANAINHGNKRAKDKKVYVKFVTTAKSFVIHVRDEGSGFNPDELADPLKPENLLKESGRGIFIVKTLIDDVQYKFRKAGTEVILTKHFK